MLVLIWRKFADWNQIFKLSWWFWWSKWNKQQTISAILNFYCKKLLLIIGKNKQKYNSFKLVVRQWDLEAKLHFGNKNMAQQLCKEKK